ncbi:MAG: methyltransferase domain-containing protein [Candidatus Aenigmatarchaeota archaeon]
MSYIDTERKYKRGPQIITRKDAGAIVAETGLQPDWRCLDLGGGSGFLALFLANLVTNGSVTCYEIKKEHAAIIKENILRSGFKNIKLVNKPGEDFIGKNFDLVTMDMKGAERVIPKIYAALKKGGYVAAYSPHIEQQISIVSAMEKAGFSNIRIEENIQREWTSVAGFTHPKPSQVVHTGFITIGRKI